MQNKEKRGSPFIGTGREFYPRTSENADLHKKAGVVSCAELKRGKNQPFCWSG